MMIRRFDPNDFHPAHEGTILARGVFGSDEIRAPFGCGIGLLKPGMGQKPERVSVSKLYYVRHGEGVMRIEDETETIHAVRNESDGDFGTFAVWWTPQEND